MWMLCLHKQTHVYRTGQQGRAAGLDCEYLSAARKLPCSAVLRGLIQLSVRSRHARIHGHLDIGRDNRQSHSTAPLLLTWGTICTFLS